MYICELTFPVIILNKSELGAALTDDYLGAFLKIAKTEEAPDLMYWFTHGCALPSQ
jgi:hypothetical protein